MVAQHRQMMQQLCAPCRPNQVVLSCTSSATAPPTLQQPLPGVLCPGSRLGLRAGGACPEGRRHSGRMLSSGRRYRLHDRVFIQDVLYSTAHTAHLKKNHSI